MHCHANLYVRISPCRTKADYVLPTRHDLYVNMLYPRVLLLVDLLCVCALVLLLDEEFTTGEGCSEPKGLGAVFLYVVYAFQFVCIWDRTRFASYRWGASVGSLVFACLRYVGLLRICTFTPLLARGIISAVVVTVNFVERWRPPGCSPDVCPLCYPDNFVDNQAKVLVTKFLV